MKKTIAIVALVVLVAVASVLGTLAYLTDTKTVENTFTMGDVKIKWDEPDVKNPEGERVTSNTYTDMAPGIVYTKDPVVTNVGPSDAWVRMIVTVENGMNWLGLYNENVWTAPQETAFNALINNTLSEEWELTAIAYVPNSERGTTDFVATLKYKTPLATSSATSAAFKEVTIPAKATAKDITTRISQNGTFHIDVKAEAMQANGFETWEEAFAAFDANK